MMAKDYNHQFDNEFIRNLLSPYLDNEVSDEERTLVEQALSASPELTDELESLRYTVEKVSALPYVPAPRPFTLSEADIFSVKSPAKSFFSLPLWFGGLAGLTAVLLLFVVGSFFVLGQPFADQSVAQGVAHGTAGEDNTEEAFPAATSGAASVMTHPTTELSESVAESAVAEDESNEAYQDGANVVEERIKSPAESTIATAPRTGASLRTTLERLPIWWVFLSGLTLGMVSLTSVLAWRTMQSKR